jgi:hypothetical protein
MSKVGQWGTRAYLLDIVEQQLFIYRKNGGWESREGSFATVGGNQRARQINDASNDP